MATNKNMLSGAAVSMALGVVVICLTGCGPPGPRAFREGRRLLEESNYTGAIEQFRIATQTLGTNAVVWDYLGLAYQHAGELDAAAAAYQTALQRNKDLLVARYNLGCVLMEGNRPEKLDAARDQLTAYTLRQPNSAPGFMKLGEIQLRLRDTPGAEKTFRQVLQLSADNVEAMNGMGMVEWQRGRYRDSAAWFTNALAHRKDFGPALLNLAIVSQSYLNKRPLALQKYNEYLALSPRPADWEAVNGVARQLELELAPPRVVTNVTTTLASQTIPPARNSGAVTNTPRPEASSNSPRPAGRAASRAGAPAETEPPLEVVEVRAPENPSATPQTSTDTTGPGTAAIAPVEDPAGGDASRPGFLQRINPFRRAPSPVETPSPQPETTSTPAAAPADTGNRAPPPPPRYTYVSPAKPAEGNLSEAERYFAQGYQAQNEKQLKDALAFYRQATQADPAYFEAQANLGLAAYDLGDMTQSLLAYETALAIKPDSFSARFKFGLALSKAGYIQDAAQELERTLAANPDETPAHLAMTHLALANLYADQFHRPGAARPHYQKVLELDPDNSQGASIRYWLKANP